MLSLDPWYVGRCVGRKCVAALVPVTRDREGVSLQSHTLDNNIVDTIGVSKTNFVSSHSITAFLGTGVLQFL